MISFSLTLPGRWGEWFKARRLDCGLADSTALSDDSVADGLDNNAVSFTFALGERPGEDDRLSRFLDGPPSWKEPGLAGGEQTEGRGAKVRGWEGGDMADSPREDGALCLGVGCWAMNCGGLPAVLRLMNGRSLSVSGNSFLGLRGLVGPAETGVAWVPCVPFSRTGPGSRVPSVLEMACRWASHTT